MPIKTPPATEEAVLQDLMIGTKLQREIAADAGVATGTVKRIKKRNGARIREMQEKLSLATLEHVDKHGKAMRNALTKDVLNTDSRTGPQSFRVLYEVAGIIGNKGGGVQVNVDQRSLPVTFDVDKMAAMKAMSGEGRHKALQKRLAELAR